MDTKTEHLPNGSQGIADNLKELDLNLMKHTCAGIKYGWVGEGDYTLAGAFTISEVDGAPAYFETHAGPALGSLPAKGSDPIAIARALSYDAILTEKWALTLLSPGSATQWNRVVNVASVRLLFPNNMFSELHFRLR